MAARPGAAPARPAPLPQASRAPPRRLRPSRAGEPGPSPAARRLAAAERRGAARGPPAGPGRARARPGGPPAGAPPPCARSTSSWCSTPTSPRRRWSRRDRATAGAARASNVGSPSRRPSRARTGAGRVGLVVAGATPATPVAPGDDRDAFDRAAEAARPAPGTSDLRAAIGVARGAATAGRDLAIRVVSSRALPPGLPDDVTAVGAGTAADDQGFVDVAVAPTADGKAFTVRLSLWNADTTTRSRTVTLAWRGTEAPLLEQAIAVPARGRAEARLDVSPPREGAVLVATLVGADAFPGNDVAALVLTPPARPSVLVIHGGAPRPFLRAVLEALGDAVDREASGFVRRAGGGHGGAARRDDRRRRGPAGGRTACGTRGLPRTVRRGRGPRGPFRSRRARRCPSPSSGAPRPRIRCCAAWTSRRRTSRVGRRSRGRASSGSRSWRARPWWPRAARARRAGSRSASTPRAATSRCGPRSPCCCATRSAGWRSRPRCPSRLRARRRAAPSRAPGPARRRRAVTLELRALAASATVPGAPFTLDRFTPDAEAMPTPAGGPWLVTAWRGGAGADEGGGAGGRRRIGPYGGARPRSRARRGPRARPEAPPPPPLHPPRRPRPGGCGSCSPSRAGCSSSTWSSPGRARGRRLPPPPSSRNLPAFPESDLRRAQAPLFFLR